MDEVMTVEDSPKAIDGNLPSQVWAWLDPHAAASDEEQLVGGIADRISGIADWLPLILGAGFVIADAVTTLAGRGDLISFIVRLSGH